MEDNMKKKQIVSAMAMLSLIVLAGVIAVEPAMADQVFQDDVIIGAGGLGNSLCVGTDCEENEIFNYNTIRLKENFIRLDFDDSSSGGNYPANDWRIVINDTENNGDNYFAVEDSTGGTTPFKVAAGARDNALYVSEDGGIGIGTATPTTTNFGGVSIHLKTGDSPKLRLEQDTSVGWGEQTWDVGGNETNFYIMDTTNDSNIPFKIEPGAADNNLTINKNGYVGINCSGGFSTVDAPLHVQETDASETLRLQKTDGGNWDVAVDDGFNIKDVANETAPFRIEAGAPDNSLHVDTSGNLTIAGDVTLNSDARLKQNVRPLEDALTLVSKLDGKTYEWKTELGRDPGRKYGMIAQEVEAVLPELVSEGKDGLKSVNYTGVVPVLVSAMKELHARNQAQQREIELLKENLREIEWIKEQMGALAEKIGKIK